MRVLKSILPFFGAIFLCVGVLFGRAPLADATTALDGIYGANVASSTLNGIARQLRLDQAAGTDVLYVLGTSVANLGILSADGTTFSAAAYSSPLPTHSAADMVVSNGRAYISAANSATPGLYRYDISGSTASFVASTTLPAGSTAVSFNGDTNTVYVTKANVLYSFETDLTRVTPTTTLVQTPTRLSYGGGKLLYVSSSGSIRRAILDGSAALVNGVTDITLVSTGISSANIKGLVTSNDGSAFYYASTTHIAKRSATSGSLLWSASVSGGVVAMDVSASTGKIFVVNSGGGTTVYHPIAPVTSVSATASGTSAVLNWETGITDADFNGTTIVRSTSGYPTSASAGTLVTSTASVTTVTDAGLSEGTYYYSFFNRTLDGYYSSAATSSVTINLPPEAPVLTANAIGASALLIWTVPADAASFLLRRSAGAFPAAISDGVTVTTTNGSVTTYTDAALSDGTYYYGLFAADAEGNYSTVATSSVAIDTVGPSVPTGFSADVSGSTVNLSWSNPADADFASIILRRSATTFPASRTDGTAVTTTTGTSYADTSLSDGTYYYSLFATDATGNVSIYATSTATISTAVAPAMSSGGGAAGGAVFITPSAAMTAPLRFSVASAPMSVSGTIPAVSVPAVTLRLNADPATVRGYAAALDPAFAGASLLPLPVSGEVTFPLPDKAGTYAVYLKYFSTSGHGSDVLVQIVAYAPAQNVAPITATPAKTVQRNFARTLKQGDRGTDVKALQAFLNAAGFLVAKTGAGSPGNETAFFGAATAQAVKRFQEAYKETILQPYGLEKGTGVFGTRMREVVNGVG